MTGHNGTGDQNQDVHVRRAGGVEVTFDAAAEVFARTRSWTCCFTGCTRTSADGATRNITRITPTRNVLR